ncbi:MAG: hypothetical protein V1922_05855 [bacterium]
MATLTAEPAQLDRLTVLRSGGETATGLDTKFKNNKGKASIEAAKDLRKVQPAGGKETMRAGLAVKEGETKFNVRNARDFKERFGAGKKGGVGSNSAEKASYHKAEQSLRENSTIALFLELKSLPAAERAQMLADASVTAEVGLNNYGAIKDRALSLIARSDAVKGLFPELDTNSLSEAQKISFLESTLFPSDDARFAARFGTRMREAYKKSVGFESVMTDEKKAELEQQKKLEDGKKDQKIKSLKDMLGLRGVVNPIGGNPYTEADIATLVDGAADTSVITDTLAANIFNRPPNVYADLRAYRVDLPNTIAKLQSQINPGRMALVRYVADPRHINEPNVIAYNAATARLAALGALYPAGNADLTAFNTGILPLIGDPAFAGLASGAKEAQMKSAEIDLHIHVRPKTTTDIEKSRDIRILQEEDLLGEIDGILGQSIADVLEERYDVMEERSGRLMQEKADKAEQDVKINIMNLKKKMSSNWIAYDPATRQKIVHKDHIKHDVTHLAYAFDKDVALKQIIARDLFPGLGGNFDRINVIDGTDMNAPANVLLTPEQLKQMEGVFTAAGTEYRDKLFADMFAARTFTDRTLNFGFGLEASFGQLGFKRDEWKYMMQRYEPEITKALEANHEAHQALQTLEAQGVKTGFNMKWLMYILAVVLGVGTGGVGAAVIPGVSAFGGIATGVGAELAAAKVINSRRTTDVNGNLN